MVDQQDAEKKQMVQLSRDCIARMVPQGAQILLREGTEVRILQDKGNTYTVDVYGNMARIDGCDADALGLTPADPLEDIASEASLEDKINHLLDQVYDPEIPVSVLALGLIYDVIIEDDPEDKQFKHIKINMTLTAPGCGMGPVMVEDIKKKLDKLPEVSSVEVDLVFDPPWGREMISDEAKLQLGLY